ncbi:TetR/AcrR family transcriptional regulator [Neolewinella antarctica]|uniref:AcrR family transcriptional regulator n=1 Tax=Neolewinella antarctica TaxID=442734 RepID=A0ABX0XAB0_9BACT|nr:TetR/AcrR family transcriptional regulator [Neolewinella antarctica]NJC25727.1 AcrR family transcriptional regulator [Neolewinella antarctica]
MEKLKEKLIETADQLYMRLGIKSVSMDDIAREMGVSKKTIYQVVGNKEQLVQLVMECDTAEDMETLKRNQLQSKDAIDEFLKNSRYFIRNMREISPATMHDLQKYYPSIWHVNMRQHQQYFRQQIEDNIERGMEEGLYRPDLVPDIIATLYVSTVSTVVDTSIFPANERSISDIIFHHSQYHLNGVVNQFGRDRVEAYLKQESLD